MKHPSIFVVFFIFISLLAPIHHAHAITSAIHHVVQPCWTADDIDGHESGHGFLSRQGITILKNENRLSRFKNLFLNNLDFISLESTGPDSTENNYYTFSGHFYDPDTGKNWLGSTTNTALNNFLRHASAAVETFKNKNIDSMSQDKIREGLHSLAYALHYLEDACVPHHAANFIAMVTWHTEFEHYAQTVQEQHRISKSIHPYIKKRGRFDEDIKNILINCSKFAKPLANETDKVDPAYADVPVNLRCYSGSNSQGAPDCDVWDKVIQKTKIETQSRVSQFIDRFIQEIL